MTETAPLNHRYFLKFLAIAGICVALMGWFLYDGMIGYPYKLEAAEAYYGEPKFKDDPKAWYEFAGQNGWNREIPKEPEEIRNEITGQYFWALLCAVLAIPFFLKYVTALGSYIEATPEEIRPSWRAAIPINTISKIDKTKWKDKGVTRIYFGNNESFVFDDFKFERKPMGRILQWVEADLSDSQIVGGPRESKAEPEDTQKSQADAAEPAAESAGESETDAPTSN